MAGVSDVDLLGEDDNLSSQPDEESGSSPWSMSGHLKDQSERLFALDSSLRVRVPFTSIECDKLRGRVGPHFSDGQVSLAIACIGLPDGRAATKNLWAKELELQGLKWMAGEACSTLTCDFTLAKSLLLSSRALQSDRPEVTSPETCFCLTRTALMPAGCFHKRIGVGTTPISSKKTSPWYCSQCSICLRCLKTFGSS